MQCARDERTADPERGERLDIAAIANAACRVDACAVGARLDRGKAVEIGTGIAADAVEGHRDDAVGPERGSLGKGSGAKESTGAVVEREDIAGRAERRVDRAQRRGVA